MRRIVVATGLTGLISLGVAAPAFGATPPGAQPGNPSPTGTGNHVQSCQTLGTEPGNAANSQSPFHEPNTATGDLGGNAGMHYAGQAGTPTDGKTTNGVGHTINGGVAGLVTGQYDVACYHQPVK
jgi:hypothetical protein